MDEAAILTDLRQRVAASEFHTAMGLEVETATPGEVTLSMRTDDTQRNLAGLIHGGVLATLADIAMGLAVRSGIEPGRRHVTIELGVHFLRPATPGRVHAVGRTTRIGSQIAFAQAEIRDEAGRILATASGTYSVTHVR